MAQNIQTNAAFSTAYMKPDPDDVGDALWGQKIGDNTGWLYYKPEKVADFHAVGLFTGSDFNIPMDANGTTWFRKYPNKNTLFGTYGGTNSTLGTCEGSIAGSSIFAIHNSGIRFLNSFSMDISGLTNGSWYPINVHVASRQLSGPCVALIESFSVWNGV